MSVPIHDFRTNSPPPGGYQYYKRLNLYTGIHMPIRVLFDEQGSAMGADRLDAQQQAFVRNANLISETEISPLIEELSKAEFDECCQTYLKHHS